LRPSFDGIIQKDTAAFFLTFVCPIETATTASGAKEILAYGEGTTSCTMEKRTQGENEETGRSHVVEQRSEEKE
jgi:hypothetical protein